MASSAAAPQVQLGMQRAGSHDALPLHSCLLHSSAADAVLQAANGALAAQPAAAALRYDPKSRRGLIKRVTLRQGFRTAAAARLAAARNAAAAATDRTDASRQAGHPPTTEGAPADAAAAGDAVLVDVLTSGSASKAERAAFPAFVEALAGVGTVAGVVESSHTSRNLSAPPQRSVCLVGQAHVFTALGPFVCRTSARSFLQVNTLQCTELYRVVDDMAQLALTDVLLDLYCGAGTIGMWLARKCARVVGVEKVAEAVADARANAALNGVANIDFVVGDLSSAQVRTLLAQSGAATADVVVVDPARAGLAEPVMSALQSSGAHALVYVSCCSQSFCRDLKALEARGWRCVRVRAVDMFPQTHHLESVARFER